ncbi:hypothetical protein HN832_02815 [archaeon]|jgi:hypothetical protein|nr:hypothetical protein [archaeon]MBT4373287.1 hypothetical protein [archaeon]MBT4531632.1 hypothetical protein [archaeon]MBT7001190.1 hypothetical protein [archaeon]MBT7282324.1 hypothetical protein [archaeon]
MKEIVNLMGDFYQALRTHKTFYSDSLFYRELKLDYAAETQGAFINLNDPTGRYAFKIHPLEIGEPEGEVWYSKIEKRGNARFNGFVREFPFIKNWRLRGILSIPEESMMSIGVVARNGRILQVKNHNQLEEESMPVIYAIGMASHLARKKKTTDDSNPTII